MFYTLLSFIIVANCKQILSHSPYQGIINLKTTIVRQGWLEKNLLISFTMYIKSQY
jgi:hypothetical protein